MMTLRDPVKFLIGGASYVALLNWVYLTNYASREELTFWLWIYFDKYHPPEDLNALLDKAFNRRILTPIHIIICCNSLLRAAETLDLHLQKLLELIFRFLSHAQIKMIANIGEKLSFGLIIAAQRQVCTDGIYEHEWPTVRTTFTLIT